MSSAASAQDVIQDNWIRILGNWASVSSIALWLYDYLSTLPTEILLIWCNEMSITSVLFLINRYSMLAIQIFALAVIAIGPVSNAMCRNSAYVWEVILIINWVVSYGLLVLRVWSISGRQIHVLLICASLVSATVALILISVFGSVSATDDSRPIPAISTLQHCSLGSPDITVINSVVTAYTLIVLVLDSYMFIFTVRTTWRHYVESKSLGQSGITYVLLRDGVMYFSIIAITELIFCVFILLQMLDDEAGYVSKLWQSGIRPYLSLLPNLVVNRIVLNLRSYSHHHHRPLTSEIGPYSTLGYSCDRVLGNIGAPLGFGDAMDSLFDDIELTSDIDSEEPQRVLDIAPST